MANGLNHVTLLGNLTDEPELQYTATGLAILTLPVGGDDRVIDDEGKERLVPWYQRVTLMGKAAESIAGRLTRDTLVLVNGSLSYRQWDDREGHPRSAVDVKAFRVEVVAPGERTDTDYATDARGQRRLLGALNHVQVIGNLTRDVEMRYTPTGVAVARAGIAVNEGWKDKRGEWQNKAHFLNLTLWRALAEASASLTKGEAIFASGRIKNGNYTNAAGEKRYTTDIVVDRLEVLTMPPRKDGAQSSAPSSTSPTASRGSGVKPLDIDEEFPPEEDLPF